MSPRCPDRRLTIPIVALLAMFSASTAYGGAFSDIAGVTEFEIDPADSLLGYTYPELLGGVRSITTGDYDQDGDEDVFVTRFANEAIDDTAASPQFVLFENRFFIAGGGGTGSTPLAAGTRIRFRIHAHGLPAPARSLFPNIPSSWHDPVRATLFPSITTADFNGDGWPDLLVGGVRACNDNSQPCTAPIIDRSLLYINCRSGFTFREIGSEAGINDSGTVCLGTAVADYNNDGRLDFFYAAGDLGGCRYGTGAPNKLYLARAASFDGSFVHGGTTITYPKFEDKTAAWEVPQEVVHHFNPTATDFDRDGWLDVFVGLRAACQDGGTECEITQNQLLRNRGSEDLSKFVDVAASLGVNDNGNAYGAAWGDWDNDSDFDLVLANNIHGDVECPSEKTLYSKLYRNLLTHAGGTASFEEVSVPDFTTVVGTQTNNGSFFFDYDLDGLQDFFMAVEANGNAFGSTLYRQTAPGVFQEVTLDEGVTQLLGTPFDNCSGPFLPSRIVEGANATFADFDLDGDLDLFVPSNFQAQFTSCHVPRGCWTFVFENTTRSPHSGGLKNYVGIRLQGTPPIAEGAWGADRDAIGSVARVYAGGKVWSQQVCAGGQDGSTWPFELTFGLGTASTIDSIAVDWHHAKVQGIANTPYHQRIDGPIAVNQRYPVIVMPSVVLVPNDEPTLQTAIDAASAGSMVLVQVASGIVGPFTLKSGVRVEAVGTQVIDAAGASAGVTLSAANNSAGTALVGFTIKNVNGNAVQITGGGSQPVTVENCTIEGSAYATRNGVVSSSTSVRVVNCAFVGPSAKGIQLGVDFWDTGTKSLFVVGCRFSNVDLTGVSRAIHVSAGSGPVHVEGNTAWNYEYGVEVVAGTTGVVFRKNLFAIGTYAGVGIFGNPPSTNNVVENNNCWGFIYNYSVNGYHGTIPPGNLSADPVFCSTTDLTLNLTSPCARANNAGGAWIGARPYVSCMSGTLGASWDLGTADTQGGTVSMPGDFKVPSGTGLVLRPLVSIKAAKTPSGANLGSDASRVELLIDGGRVETRGTLTSPVILASAETSPTVSDWYGIRVTAGTGGEAILKGAQIRDSVYGLYSGSAPDSIRIEDCTISNNSTACVKILAGGGASSNVYVKGGTMSVASPSTAPEAFYATNPKSLFIDKLTVLGGSTASYGIRVTGPVGGGSEAEVWESTVSGFPAGSGLYAESGSPAFRGCTVSNCKWGSNFQSSQNPSLAALSVSGRSASTAISGCTTGAYITGTVAGKPFITGGTITAGTSSGIIGLYTEGDVRGYYKNLTISGGHTAVKANSQGPDTLMNSCVTGFASVGVQVMNAGQIVLGGVSSKANNIYSSVSGVSKYVTVKTPRVYGTPDVDAQYNWWGESPAPSTKFSNYVSYANALTGPVSCTGNRAFTLSRDVPLMRPFAVHPNPSTNQVVMSFSVPVGIQTQVELRVFDVSGRLVRTLLSERMAPGEVEAQWDGRDGAGRVMPGGLFFARLQVGTEIQTRKMIRLSR